MPRRLRIEYRHNLRIAAGEARPSARGERRGKRETWRRDCPCGRGEPACMRESRRLVHPRSLCPAGKRIELPAPGRLGRYLRRKRGVTFWEPQGLYQRQKEECRMQKWGPDRVGGRQRWEEERGKNHRIPSKPLRDPFETPSKPLRNITGTSRVQHASSRLGAG